MRFKPSPAITEIAVVVVVTQLAIDRMDHICFVLIHRAADLVGQEMISTLQIVLAHALILPWSSSLALFPRDDFLVGRFVAPLRHPHALVLDESTDPKRTHAGLFVNRLGFWPIPRRSTTLGFPSAPIAKRRIPIGFPAFRARLSSPIIAIFRRYRLQMKSQIPAKLG